MFQLQFTEKREFFSSADMPCVQLAGLILIMIMSFCINVTKAPYFNIQCFHWGAKHE